MGLDNGFYVVSNKRQITREDLPSEIIYPFDTDFEGKVEIIYWRKNWGLRNAVLDTIANRFTEDYLINITDIEEIYKIIRIIQYFMNEQVWQEEGQSIWSYEEILPTLKQDIYNLTHIIDFLHKNPDIYLQFYDSY